MRMPAQLILVLALGMVLVGCTSTTAANHDIEVACAKDSFKQEPFGDGVVNLLCGEQGNVFDVYCQQGTMQKFNNLQSIACSTVDGKSVLVELK